MNLFQRKPVSVSFAFLIVSFSMSACAQSQAPQPSQTPHSLENPPAPEVALLVDPTPRPEAEVLVAKSITSLPIIELSKPPLSLPAVQALGTPDPLSKDPNNPYYQIASTETSTVSEETPLNESALNQAQESSLEEFAPINLQAGVDPLSIIQVLANVFDFIRGNQITARVDRITVSALPNASINNFQILSGWKPERTIVYHKSFKNLFGSNVIDLVYKVHLIFGGSLNKKGQYIAAVNVIPSSFKVAWGYTLQAKATVVSITNARTSEDPLAAIRLDTAFQLSSWIRADRSVEQLLLQGDGLIENVRTGQILCRPASR